MLKNRLSGNSSVVPILPYLLFVGTRDKYKNFKFLINSIRSILISKDIHLLCVGGGSFTSGEISMITDLGIEKKVIQRNISHDELAQIYNQALALIFPSEYEGFGLPI